MFQINTDASHRGLRFDPSALRHTSARPQLSLRRPLKKEEALLLLIFNHYAFTLSVP